MTQINLPPDLPPIPNRGMHRDVAQHAAPTNDRLIVSCRMPSGTTQQDTNLILDNICQLLCLEITSHAPFQEDTRDQAAYHVGWHDAIHSLRHLILSRDHSSEARTRIDGIPLAPEFNESVSLSDATDMLMSTFQPFAMTPSSPISREMGKKKEPQASLFPSGGLFSPVSVHSRRPDGPCDMRFLNEDVPSNRSPFNSSDSSSTPFNTPSSSALSSPIDTVLRNVLTAPRDQSGPETNRLNQSKIINGIDTTKLLMLYEREARVSEHRIITELARSNILRQSILQDRFFGNVPSFETDAVEVEEFGAEINEPFVGAPQQKRAISEARQTFLEWSRNEPSYKRMLKPSLYHPPETRRQPRTGPTPVSASTCNLFGSSSTSGAGSSNSSTGLFGGRSSSTCNLFGSSGTSGAASSNSSTGLFGGRSSPMPWTSGAGSGNSSTGLFGGRSSSLFGTSGVSSSNPPTGGLFGGPSTPIPARSSTSREAEVGISGVSSGSSSTGGFFGNLSASMPARSSTSREIGMPGVSSGSSSTGGLFGNLSAPMPARSSTPRETGFGTPLVNSSSSPTGVVWGGLNAPLPAHLHPAKDTDIEREIRAESIVCGPTLRVHINMFGTETFSRSLLPHLPTVGGCKPQPVGRFPWERSALPSDTDGFSTSDWAASCRKLLALERAELLAEERERLRSLSPARTPTSSSMPERLSPFGEPRRKDVFTHPETGLVPVSSSLPLGNVTKTDTTASPEPVELPASTSFDRNAPPPEPNSAEYAANSVKPLFSQITPSDAPKSPSSHSLRSRRGEYDVNPLINLQTATRPLPSQRPVAAAASRHSPSMTRSELPPAGLSSPTSLASITSSTPSLFQMPGQFPIQQDSRPVPLVEVPTDQSEEEDSELPKIVLTSADSSDNEEEDL
ncbi:hypothetical protein CkaCkLH20_12678 [Colletotrichum karsti]|uniref:Uncharacterized protein n=1 Tax=Colletotrichum karsti TaxID=1095194 RepID=A0A9P6LCV9_9PEZI|nr:uncharacterized protein CkaCkLH20_12678 [Colletotrichum karsti]KAF9869879.1 hypothetical protein CkaCkLH20_12678 [Colletotrichum karsti]